MKNRMMCMPIRVGQSAMALYIAALLGGCGGGGGGNATADAGIDFPVQTAFVNLFTTNATYTATAKDAQGNTYNLAYQIQKLPDESVPAFSTSPLKVVMSTISLQINGSVYTDTTKDYFSTSPLLLWGTYDSSGFTKINSQSSPPATAKVGTSGDLGTASLTTTVNGTPQTATETIRWSLEAASATTAWLCLNLSTSSASGPSTESDCVRIDQAGAISGFKSTVTVLGTTLSFT